VIELRPENEHPSRWTLQRLVAGDLPADEARSVQEHADGCGECGDALAALQAEKHEFALSPVKRRVADALRAEAEKNRSAPSLWARLVRPRIIGPVGALAAAAVALLVLVPGLLGDGPAERSKGAGFEFGFAVLRDGRPEMGVSGEKLAAGDRVQFVYGAPMGGYLYVLGVDTLGQVSQYFPPPGSTAIEVAPGRDRPLPHSVVLDAAPEERVFALLCASPFDPSELTGSLRRMGGSLGDLVHSETLPLDCVQRYLDLPRRSP